MQAVKMQSLRVCEIKEVVAKWEKRYQTGLKNGQS